MGCVSDIVGVWERFCDKGNMKSGVMRVGVGYSKGEFGGEEPITLMEGEQQSHVLRAATETSHVEAKKEESRVGWRQVQIQCDQIKSGKAKNACAFEDCVSAPFSCSSLLAIIEARCGEDEQTSYVFLLVIGRAWSSRLRPTGSLFFS